MGTILGKRALALAALVIALALAAFMPAGTAHAADKPLTTSSTSGQGAIQPGVYYIQPAVGGTGMLDVLGASKKSGANAQIWGSNKTAAQRWRVARNADGTYTLRCEASGLYLDLSGCRVANGSNIWQYAGNGSAAQKWRIESAGGGAYRIATAAAGGSSWVVDVAGAGTGDGTNVWLYRSNGSAAQKWYFIPASPSVSSPSTVVDGWYELHLASASSYVLDVSGASRNNGANVQIYSRNGTNAQKWYVHRESDGYYSLRSGASDKMLDVAGAGAAMTTNVWQYAGNGSAAQRWAITKNSDGTYTLTSKASGLVLDVAGGRAANGTNVWQYASNGTAAQRWTLTSTTYTDQWAAIEAKYKNNASVQQILEVKYQGGSSAQVVLRAKSGGSWRTVLSCQGYVGSEGIGQASMYSTRTPSGDFGITKAFGIKSNPGAKLPYVQVNQNMWWCGDSTAYNQLIDITKVPHYCQGEHLIDYAPHYNYGLFFDYNTNPVKYGAGSAFFVHCTGGARYTGGCIAVSEQDMITIIRNVSSGARLCIY